MLKLAALAVAAATASAPQALSSTSPWWEKITVTVTADGDAQSCTYESNLSSGTPTDGCEVVGANASVSQASSSSSPDEWTRITFERRFIPGDSKPQASEVHPGETLLGGQIMALAIDGGGKVNGCKVIAKSGDVTPDYGCDEASAEKFQPTSGSADSRVGFMTIMVYGHSENVA